MTNTIDIPNSMWQNTAMRIYTRTGDTGETGLYGNTRLDKDSQRIRAIGDIDELNAFLGYAHSLISDTDIADQLNRMQSELFDLGADLAVLDAHCQSDSLRISKDLVLEQERMIDCLQQELPPITYFILPGGLTSASVLHLARTVCRRAERRVVSLKKSDAINPEILQYLNRMSDLLFVLARVVNHRAGAPEINWKSPIERDKR